MPSPTEYMSGRGQYIASPTDTMSGFGQTMASEDKTIDSDAQFMDSAATENHNPSAAIQFGI